MSLSCRKEEENHLSGWKKDPQGMQLQKGLLICKEERQHHRLSEEFRTIGSKGEFRKVVWGLTFKKFTLMRNKYS